MPDSPSRRMKNSPKQVCEASTARSCPKGDTFLRWGRECETLEGGQLKIGRFRHFEVYCDEPARIGGSDEYPQPLTYVAMGVGF